MPTVTHFKPAGETVVRNDDDAVNLTIDELEAIRLKDFLGMLQEEAAQKMAISQPTFHRLLASARRKVADGLVNGKSIKIKEEGDFIANMTTDNIDIRGTMRGRGAGRGRRGEHGTGFGGPPVACVCTSCGHRVPKVRGTPPCTAMKCPRCGAVMIREREGR